MVHKATRVPIDRIIDVDGHERVESSRVGRPFDETTRMVCANCNGGWMARLESATKTLFTAMTGTNPLVLEQPAQQTLAAWALKTAIVLDHAQGRPWQPSAMSDERQYLAAAGVPSAHVLVWLAACFDGPPAHARLWGTSLTLKTAGAEVVNAPVFGVTLSLGPACFQVLYSSVPEMPEAFALEERPALALIWPYRDEFDWGSRNDFANHDFHELSAALPKILKSALSPPT